MPCGKGRLASQKAPQGAKGAPFMPPQFQFCLNASVRPNSSKICAALLPQVIGSLWKLFFGSERVLEWSARWGFRSVSRGLLELGVFSETKSRRYS
jgi:hypothetical protein